MVKLKEIAEKLGMGVSTVSAVLNEKDYCYVSEEKKKLIKDTAEAMGYVPNRMSRGMKGLPTQTIGIIGWLFAVPMLSRLMDCLSMELSKMGYTVLLGDSRHKDQKMIVSEFLSRGIDGLLINSVFRKQELEMILQHNPVPYVIINQECDGLSVTLDRRKGAYEALEHMVLKHGRRRPVFVCNRLEANVEKFEGFKEAAGKYGLAPSYLEAPDIVENMKNSATKVIAAKFDAVLASNDVVAGMLMRHLQSAGISIPEDISVIGFDGIDYLCGMTSPPLSSVFHPVEKVAKKSVELLMTQISGVKVPDEIHYIEPFLKTGGSCGCKS